MKEKLQAEVVIIIIISLFQISTSYPKLLHLNMQLCKCNVYGFISDYIYIYIHGDWMEHIW